MCISCCLELTFSVERHSHTWIVFPFLEALAISCAKDLRVFKAKDKTQTFKKYSEEMIIIHFLLEVHKACKLAIS